MNCSKFLLLFLIILKLNSSGFSQTKNLDENHCIPALDTLDGQEVLRIVEKMPAFEGGMDKLYKWFGKNIEIKKDVKRMGLDSKFLFTFVIDTLGHLRNFCVIRHYNYAILDELAIIQLNQTNPWQAGENNGKKVPVRLILPVYICFR